MTESGHSRVLLLTAMLVAVTGVGFFFIGKHQGKVTGRRSERQRDQGAITTGPWGALRYWNSQLEMPPGMIAQESKPVLMTRWYFGAASPGIIEKILIDSGLSSGAISKLMATLQTWPTGGYVMEPPDDLVLAVPPEARKKLYHQLKQWPLNAAISMPTRFEKIGKRDWLDQADISPKTADLARQLIYREGDTQLFVDYDIVLRSISDNREAREFVRTMTRQNCIMGSLVVRPEDSLDELAAYWGRGGRENDVRTLLESARWSDASHEIPILLLLPRFARDRLYRYRRDDDPVLANCHYSSVNFFFRTPNNAYTNLEVCSQKIDTDYQPVTDGSRQLGDIVMLMIGEHSVVHSCNIVAGDIVFTKNGTAQGQPWVLADLKQIVNYFSIEQPVTIRIVRSKEFAK